MAGAPAGCVRYRRLARFTPKPSAGCALCTLAGGSPRWQARSGVAASRPACGGADDSPDPTRLSIALVPKPWARVEPRSSQGRARVGPGSGQGRARVVGPGWSGQIGPRCQWFGLGCRLASRTGRSCDRLELGAGMYRPRDCLIGAVAYFRLLRRNPQALGPN